ncbi:transcriptional regulator [Streptomyces sp. NPDC001795]|uniref:transcriptional regulator n=1 Tax=Streptomyces sp. NPDC001795 TaxID=3154525 RepID=UPI003317A12F
MTTVRTPPPPPLPVRQRTQIPSGGLSPMLSRLAEERATGVLMREGGVLYLSDGQVVYAESPATPGLDVLLTARGALDEDGWREAVAQAGARRLVGRFLVDSGRIGEGALELCHLGALYDAAYFVLGPSSAPARFRYGEAHWLGPVHPVPVSAVERETVRRRELLHSIWPDPATDEGPLVRADRPTGSTVTPRQGAVLDRVDGVRTAADISRALGRPAFHTLVDVRRLAAAGVVSARTAAPAPAPVPVPVPVPVCGVETPAPIDQLPPFVDPHITLLKRLRDALEAL